MLQIMMYVEPFPCLNDFDLDLGDIFRNNEFEFGGYSNAINKDKVQCQDKFEKVLVFL